MGASGTGVQEIAHAAMREVRQRLGVNCMG